MQEIDLCVGEGWSWAAQSLGIHSVPGQSEVSRSSVCVVT